MRIKQLTGRVARGLHDLTVFGQNVPRFAQRIKLRPALLICAALPLAAGCLWAQSPAKSRVSRPWMNPALSTSRRAELVLRQMTLK